ncbi:hypothetical protein TNCV_2560961 [Trichonephila clavipes]|uniref:Tc1-like transposase DDE domain-containing protein n=1 Tax=Trichonephila clavipes TaxID=2585209 RepID=A0A8X6R6A0_TRICX|nr:hypothetical protein TNCV_2560961 [Trichonephila clavipes]
MSTRLRLPLTGNQWCDERWAWTTEGNDIVFTDESCFCLQYHDGRIELLPYSASSPDLSSIENVWSILAQRLAQDTPPVTIPG